MDFFQIISPSSWLAPYIKQYWFLETGYAGHSLQRIIPSGCISLSFHRGEQMFSLSEQSAQARGVICGQSTGYFDLRQTGKVDMVSIVFLPYAARFFFNFPMTEFSNRTIAADDLNVPGLNELQERLMETGDHALAVRLIESFLLKRLQVSGAYNYHRIASAVRLINSGETKISLLAQSSCLGYKQFKRVFSEYVGSNPKDFLRIIRFQKALYTLQSQPGMNLTQLACRCGFYDQSHMIREFRHFSGYTPGEYLATCAPYSDYFS